MQMKGIMLQLNIIAKMNHALAQRNSSRIQANCVSSDKWSHEHTKIVVSIALERMD